MTIRQSTNKRFSVNQITKVNAFPVVAIVTNDQLDFVAALGTIISSKIHLESYQLVAPSHLRCCAKSPKSVAFPVDAIVTKSITLVELEGSDITTHEKQHELRLTCSRGTFFHLVKSPKSCAFPVLQLLRNQLYLALGELPPPANNLLLVMPTTAIA